MIRRPPRAARGLLCGLLALAGALTTARAADDAQCAAKIAQSLIPTLASPAADGRWFRQIDGPAPVIVTAPHVARVTRRGQPRFADGPGTGALALSLHRRCGVTVLHTTHASPSDPNFYDDDPFKHALGRLIDERRPRLVLDIHASRAARPWHVDVGTMHGRSLLGQPALRASLFDALRAEGLGRLSQDYFPAAKQRTVTRYAAARGVPALQLEINVTLLGPHRDATAADDFARTLNALTRYLVAIDACMPQASTCPVFAPTD